MGYKADEYRTSRKNPVDKLRADADLDMGIYIGEVIVTPKDESHSGRIPVYIPMLSKDRNDPRGYFNCYWSSPFAGTTPSAKVGPQKEKYQDTMKTYGMWMVPPDPGNFVLVIFGDGKKKNPIIIGCMFPDQMQNMVPGNPAGTTFGTKQPLPVAEKNRGSDDKSQGKNVARPLNPYIAWPIIKQGLVKDPIRGITTAGARRESPSQVYGILTPGPMDKNVDTGAMDGTNRLGGHSFVMDDHLDQRHIRLRTAGGSQLLLDDTNEIVYVINSPGTAWVELAKDGSINVFSDEDLNMRATSNVNIRADDTVNIDGGKRVNINAGLLESAGSTVDTLKLGAETGGDIFLQAGDTINSLTNKSIKMQSKDGDIEVSTKGMVALYGEGSIKTKTTGSTTIESGADSFVSSGGSAHIVSGGQSFVKGSTVHLNDGGSSSSGVVPGPIEPLTVTVFKDEPTSIPVFSYDHESPGNKNPIPTGGVRKSDPGELPTNVTDTAGFKDERGEKIDVASTTTMITTREPWFNHLTEDKTVPTGYTEDQREVDRDLGRRYPPATSGTGYEGPDSVVNDDGSYDLGTGFDGVEGGMLDQHVRNQYFDPATGAPKNPPTASSMVPDYKAMPNMKSQMAMGGGLATTFDGQVAPALTDGISTSTHFSAGEVPLSFAGDFDAIPPDMGGATVMGYKHILGDAEREAGCIAWGDGKNFDPTSATTMIYPKGSKSLSTKEISDIVANAGPNTDLSKYGIEKASSIMPKKFGSNDQAYVVRDDRTKSMMFVNRNSTGISKQASKNLLANDLLQHGLGVRNTIKKPMSLGQIAATTLLHHHTGPSIFQQHPVVSLLNKSNNSTKRNVARMFLYEKGNSSNYVSKGNLMSLLFQSSDSMWPKIAMILAKNGDYDLKAYELLDLHRQVKRLRPYN